MIRSEVWIATPDQAATRALAKHPSVSGTMCAALPVLVGKHAGPCSRDGRVLVQGLAEGLGFRIQG